jgi:hypothetical protein
MRSGKVTNPTWHWQPALPDGVGWREDLPFAGFVLLVAFVLLAAACVPRNGIKARRHYPMIPGVKTWAFTHLIVAGRLADVVLFGTFLAWAVLDYIAALRAPPTRRARRVVTRPSHAAVLLRAAPARDLCAPCSDTGRQP